MDSGRKEQLNDVHMRDEDDLDRELVLNREFGGNEVPTNKEMVSLL